MNLKIEPLRINIAKKVGGGYKTFWNFKGPYRIVKGSRSSKKSKTTALWFIYNMMKYPESNTLVVRKTYRTIKDSCFTELKWAANRLQVSHLWDFKESPLEAKYKPTGQKIYFRGLDDSLKITSITVEKGYLCWLWIEEAYEIMQESDFDILDESIRGKVPEPLFKQVTMTFNPWNEKHWIKKRFFDVNDPDVLAMTTNYLINEWLGKSDLQLFENMKLRNPRRYKVAGLGGWGIVEGLVYENFKEETFEIADLPDDTTTVCGLDYGYTNDPTAFVVVFYSPSKKKVYIWDEFYQKGLSNHNIYKNIINYGYGKEKITADSAEPKSNAELRSYGLKVVGAKKGRDSIINGIQWIQDCQIIIHPRCVNFITEINNYCFAKDKFNKATNNPVDDFNHLMDAMRYALERFVLANKEMDTQAQIKALKAYGL